MKRATQAFNFTFSKSQRHDGIAGVYEERPCGGAGLANATQIIIVIIVAATAELWGKAAQTFSR
jgi:hypothetical protein